MKFGWLMLGLAAFGSAADSFVKTKDGIHVDRKDFPWELVVDKGKLLGCVYDDRFYSLGSILILESIPRKCEIGPDKHGLWTQLSESELAMLKENIETQQAIERESTYIGNKPINKEEARLIRYLRRVKEFAAQEEG
ncbi:hypothetical protein [Gallaecimonas sp. GXIMD4217]|uniref:hypothetical protein n=1 Tax=Gallaecimonas sp. GXIMD4217 TaxID=3131927 RepID=UPI00311ADFD8